MAVWIALLRGINVGGASSLSMKALVSSLKKRGIEDVKTYVQSGNLVFRAKGSASAVARTVAAAAGEHLKTQPHVLVLSAAEFKRAAAGNPFTDAEAQHKSLHLWFLETPPAEPDLAALQAVKTKTEAFTLDGAVFYLRAPDGIGRSKLAAQIERRLGVNATARNWRTVQALIGIVDAL